MAGPVGALDAAIYSKLTSGTALTALLSGTTAVYNRLAPMSVSMPLVVFQWQGGGDENLTPSRMRNVVYVIKGVAETLSAAEAIDEQVDALLHDKALTVTGWTNFWLARTQDVAYAEVDPAGEAIYHTGGLYRVRLGE